MNERDGGKERGQRKVGREEWEKLEQPCGALRQHNALYEQGQLRRAAGDSNHIKPFIFHAGFRLMSTTPFRNRDYLSAYNSWGNVPFSLME